MDISKELDGQVLTRAFSFSNEKDRAMYGLRGILAGVVADNRLNEKELLFLDAWLKTQQYLSEDKDVLAILGQVGDILEDGVISREELEQMQSRIEQILSAKDSDTSESVGHIEELIGFLTGIASDGVLNDQEINAMSAWLDRNESIKEVWPASVIVNRLAIILEDGIITDEERDDLLVTVYQVTESDPTESGVSFQASTEVWEDTLESLPVSGAMFCLTGDFVSGDRDSVDLLLKCLGGTTNSSINSSVDYLVIGTLASRDWLYTAHGRKIEKALLLKRDGSDIKIITERTLLKHTH
ncbi:MAG: NAD-dependent DNA ligase [SAR86 cluster bacterium]|uniref:NAD-dependent DNA ligase n=1 Tax=SAR86 cluster bacterium TaxID=2030880 RepID=A0A2A5B8P8_9GAMM|nr:MAG: NAD-dependent DNA ligase [SAR86 cluster bacterium]